MPAKECGKLVDTTALQDVLDQKTLDKLKYCQESSFVMSNPDYHHCPTPDCSNIVYYKNGPPVVDCFKCQKTSCLKCGVSPYHNGMTCEEHKIQAEERDRRLLAMRRASGGGVDRSRAGEETIYDYQPTDESLSKMNIVFVVVVDRGSNMIADV
eukprot:CAMPEP_0178929850 /NCGR_PEP_ID=MMETSP0786-20121207/20876_1 /TAXON_ID=186022 /ORGANISM="Thalassionema frauenfeldii, Strain CCMP 1798" /LENGTH=153 /DNA_ID=CAMNT_0020606247 /DNA_START=203 /DNA_END=665 /DNA_ORIENTATION=-